MWIVRLAIRQPYTFVVVALLIAILGVTAIVTMPVDIFTLHRHIGARLWKWDMLNGCNSLY
jgi:hypothetical protein